jgi:hypothetical protein
MAAYYKEHGLPEPRCVLVELNRNASRQGHALGALGAFLCVLLGSKVCLDSRLLALLRECLAELESLVGEPVSGSEIDCVRLRMSLTTAEVSLQRRLRKADVRVGMMIEHLNQSHHLELRSLEKIAGSSWPR